MLTKTTIEVGPNLFASVMGTGIIANAAATLPILGDALQGFALMVWVAAALLLLVLSAIKILQTIIYPKVIQRQLNDPVLAQFFGAPPMALLTVAGGTLLVGHSLLGMSLAIELAWWLWLVGTVLGAVTAVLIPYLLFTRFVVKDDSAFGGWLMPVVPPMVSAAIGALLVPHMSTPEGQQTLLYLCYAMFGLSMMAAFIIITMIWSRLAHAGTSGSARVPTLWIVLGPLGQSITAAGALGAMSIGVIAEPVATGMNTLAILFGVPVWGFAMFWFMLATLLTVRAWRLDMGFGLTWWAFTFPIGTCVTGTTQLALHTGLPLFSYAAVVLFGVLIFAWIIAAAGTMKGVLQGDILKASVDAPAVMAKKGRSRDLSKQ